MADLTGADSFTEHDPKFPIPGLEWMEPLTLEDRTRIIMGRKRDEQAYWDEFDRRKRDGKPWECEFCTACFKTKRGTVRHEGNCYKNPDARDYQTGEATLICAGDGTIIGQWRADGRSRLGASR
jgi:hypothetical protein